MVESYTRSEIEQTIKTLQEASRLNDRLSAFCTPVAVGLGYESVVDVNIDKQTVAFQAEMFGPYQSHWRQNFEFPVDWLTLGAEYVLAQLKTSPQLSKPSLR
jgi:hypothetical protein